MFAIDVNEPRPALTTSADLAVVDPVSGRASEQGNATDAKRPDAEKLTDALRVRAAKKKKKRQMKPGAPANTITRGFQTPDISGGEDSDYSPARTPRLRALQSTASGSNSPTLRPSSLTRALSGLKLNSEATASDASAQASSCSSPRDESRERSSDNRLPEIATLELPLVRDFASEHLEKKTMYGAVEGGLRRDSPHRKMTASDFEPLKTLGKGAFGTVLLVKQHSTGRLFAQKQLKKASLTVRKHLVEQTKTERAILESVNRHPFVVKLFYAFQDQRKLYLILEYAQGGELFHHLAMERTFTEEVAAFYMGEMVLALDYLHRELGVVYRDLKPENCLLDAGGHLLLTDFGLSKVPVEDPSNPEGGSKCNSFMGTVDYMAPEVIQGRPYDAAVDWWSLGALGYDLLTGSPPFSANNHAKTQQKIVHGKLATPYYLSPDAKDLLARLLRKEPRKRLGGNMPKDLATIKSHRFFRKIDWKALERRELLAPIQPIITDPAAAENFDTEFTNMPMSPVQSRHLGGLNFPDAEGQSVSEEPAFGSIDETFGGFSYVASTSLLDE